MKSLLGVVLRNSIGALFWRKALRAMHQGSVGENLPDIELAGSPSWNWPLQ